MITKKITHRDVITMLARVPEDVDFRRRVSGSAHVALATDGFATNSSVEDLLESLAGRSPNGSKSMSSGRDGIDFARDM
jgi:hypothetical protein